MFINQHLIGFIRGREKMVIKTCLMQLILTIMGTLMALHTAFIVRMIRGEDRIFFFSSPFQIFGVISLFLVLRYLLMKRKAVLSEICGWHIKSSLRERLLTKLFSLGPAYTAKHRTGDIASMISVKVDYLTEYYTIYLPCAVSSIVNAAILLAVLSVIERKTAAIAFLSCAGLLISPMLFYFLMRERGIQEMQAHAEYYSDCLDSLQGMVTLKSFNANEEQKRKIYEKGEYLRRSVMGQLSITMIENVVLQFFIGLGSALSIGVAAYQCFEGRIGREMLIYLLFLIGACFGPMQLLIQAWHMGYRGISASYSIDRLLKEVVSYSLLPAETREGQNLSSGASIRFEEVSFTYHGEEEEVLHDICFTIPSGTMTALVGVSGSGKSTIAHLLAGFYEVKKGRIQIGDYILCEATADLLQQNMAAVWQDAHLFFGTVEENLRIGKPDASFEQLEEAAEKANIRDFIHGLPEGYQTLIGERGMRFSGGERQRIALARAFLRDAPIILLDEATSSLDRENEMAIQESFLRLSKGKTALVIAHRLATIRHADQIILLEKGKIIAKGIHEELCHTSEVYRQLMGDQFVKGGSL